MDPITAIGLAASITQLIEVTMKVIKYLNKVRDAPKDQVKLVQEASSLLALLNNLKYTPEGANTIESWLGPLPSQGLKDVLDRLQHLLEELVKKLKPEHEHCLKELAKRFLWTLEKKEILETLAEIERVKSLIVLALHRDHIRLSLAIKADITNVNDNVHELGNNVLTIADGITELQIHQQDQERQHAAQGLHKENQAAVDWLSHLNFSSKQIDVFSQHQEGTGSWFLKEQAFKRWCDRNERVLWCPGLPGAGKTILASVAIDHLQRAFPTSNVACRTTTFCAKTLLPPSSLYNPAREFWEQGGQKYLEVMACLKHKTSTDDTSKLFVYTTALSVAEFNLKPIRLSLNLQQMLDVLVYAGRVHTKERIQNFTEGSRAGTEDGEVMERLRLDLIRGVTHLQFLAYEAKIGLMQVVGFVKHTMYGLV